MCNVFIVKCLYRIIKNLFAGHVYGHFKGKIDDSILKQSINKAVRQKFNEYDKLLKKGRI